MLRRAFSLTVVSAVLLVIAAPCSGRVLHVPQEIGKIRDAIALCDDYDTVLVAPGVYRDTSATSLGFMGKHITLMSESGPEETTILCRMDTTGGIDYVMEAFDFHQGEDTTSVLDGFTVTRLPYVGFMGPGVYFISSSPKIKNCRFLNLYSGGAFYLAASSPVIEDCVFEGNSVGNSAYKHSSATDRIPSFRDGAALYCSDSSSPTVRNCTFRYNSTDDQNGGAIACYNSTPDFYDCDFHDNQTHSYIECRQGGAVYISSESVATFIRCSFRRNQTRGNGAAASILESTAIFQNCLVDSNYVSDYCSYCCEASGAGVFSTASTVTITNCTITRNRTIYDEEYDIGGTGAAIYAVGNSAIQMQNSIMAFNESHYEALACDPTSTISISCSDMYGNMPGDWSGCAEAQGDMNGNFSSFPNFCDLVSDDFSISSESPCAPPNNDCGVLIGAYDVNCTSPPGLPPQILTRTPGRNEISVPPSSAVSATFNRPLMPNTATSDNFRVTTQLMTPLNGSVNYSGSTNSIVYTHPWPFTAGDIVTVVQSKDMMAIDGVRADSASSWSFTVGVGNSFGYGTKISLDSVYADMARLSLCVILANVDGTGGPDAVSLGGYDADSMWVLNNDGSGVFRPGDRYPTGTNPECVVAADFDNDGNADLAVANGSQDDVSFYFNVGNGTFDDPVSYGVEHYPIGTTRAYLCPADIDNDGDMDVLATSWGGFSLLRNNGDGVMDSYTSGGHDNTEYLCVGDYNHDGLPDLASIYNSFVGYLRVMMGTGDGLLDTGYVYTFDDSRLRAPLISANLDGDSTLDLAVFSESQISVLTNDGSGSFALLGSYDLPSSSVSAARSCQGDFDGDVDIDIAVWDSDGIVILFNDGEGHFDSSSIFPSGYSSYAGLCAADIDGDRDIDLVGGNNDLLLVFRNQPALADIVIAPTDTLIQAGDSLELTAFGQISVDSLIPLNGGLTWSSSDNSLVHFYEDGRAECLKPGVCSVYVDLDIISDTAEIIIYPRVTPWSNETATTSGEACSLFVAVADEPDSVFLTYRPCGSTTYEQIRLKVEDDSVYVGTIPDGSLDSRGLEYGFRAWQNGAHADITTDSTGLPYILRAVLQDQEVATVLDGVFLMIGFPFDVDPSGFEEVLEDDLGDPSDGNWKLGCWRPDIESYAKNNEVGALQRGVGYWIWSSAIADIDASGMSALPDTLVASTQTWYASVSLESGWNQISAPFAFPMLWENRFDPLVSFDSRVWEYEGGLEDPYYAEADTLKPSVGYWVYNRTSSSKDLLLPYADARYQARASLKKTASAVDDCWSVGLTISTRSTVDKMTVLGVCAEALTGIDHLDFSHPPSIGKYASVRSILKDDSGRRHYLGGDYRPLTGQGWTYAVDVRGNVSEPGYLSIRDEGPLPDWITVVLRDPVADRSYELIPGDSVRLPAIPSEDGAVYEILIGTESYTGGTGGSPTTTPNDFYLDQNYPNPFNPTTKIRFGLPVPAHVTVTVYNVLGQKVDDLIDSDLSEGHHVVEWKGTDASGETMASGVYFVRMIAGDWHVSRKMLLMK